MSQWVVYEHPKEHPDHFVLKRWDIFRGHNAPVAICAIVQLADTLEEVQDLVPQGCACLGLCADHDPCIVEMWI
jgi:hypothetical protein